MQGSKALGTLEDENLVTLEHVMPKTMGQHWQHAAQDEDEYRASVNLIGNLTLIDRQTNRAASNESFGTKKKDAFPNSDIIITKALCQYDDWTVKEIKSRQEQLAEIAVQIWSVPYS